MTAIMWPGPLNSPETSGKLTISGVDMHTWAWNVLDVIPLWAVFITRGENVRIPMDSGTLAQPRRLDEMDISLSMIVNGVCNLSGVPYANRWVGLETNLAYLHTNVFAPPTAPTATRAATLLMPSGATRTANIQVLSFEPINPGTTAAVIEGVLNLRLPAGRFV